MMLGPRRLPLILQSARSECGLACLAMVANWHGHKMDLAGIRERFTVSMAGARLSDLTSLAGRIGLNARALKADLQDLKHLQTPAILHWNLNHFVVLKSVRGNRAVVHDPAAGVRTLEMQEISRHYTGVALELSPADDFSPIVAEKPVQLKQVWGRVAGVIPAVSQVLILSVLLQVLALAAPLFLQIVVDQAITPGAGSYLIGVTIAFGGLYLISALTAAARSWAILYFSTSMNFQMVRRLFTRLLRLPASFFENRHVGDILSRMSSARTIQATLTEGLASAAIDVVLGLLTLVVIAAYSLTAFAIVFSTSCALIVLNLIVTARLRSVQEGMIAAAAAEQTHMMESIRAAPTIKLFGAERDRVNRWQSRYSAVMNASFSVGRHTITLKFLEDVLLGIQLLLIVLFAVMEVQRGALTVGMLTALIAYRQAFAQHVAGFLSHVVQFRLLRVHLARLSDLVHTPIDDAHAPDVVPPRLSGGSVRFEEVTFRYGSGEPYILKEASLDVPDGAFVALIGPSGSGKSTAVRLILGLQQPESGAVMAGGQRLSGGAINVWRQGVAAVLQNDRLFSGSIADNIAFFDPSPDMDAITRAAADADIHEHVLGLPMGYLTPVGDMGSTLSGGQYQRVLLARALYRNPKVLLLDEGTANLDPESEQRIVDIISNMKATRIVVAHRPALVERADMVYRVEGKQIHRVR